MEKGEPTLETKRIKPIKETFSQNCRLGTSNEESRQDSLIMDKDRSNGEGGKDSRETLPSKGVRFTEDNSPLEEEQETPSSPNLISSILNNKKPDGKHRVTRLSVFERLWKAETVASIYQKVESRRPMERNNKRSVSAPPKLRRRKNISQLPKKSQRKTVRDKKNSEKEIPLTKSSKVNRSKSTERERRLEAPYTFKKSNSDKKLIPNVAKKSTKARRLGRRASFDSGLPGTRRGQNGKKIWRDGSLFKKVQSDSAVMRDKMADEILDDTFSLTSNGPPRYIEFSSRTRLMYCDEFDLDEESAELDSNELGLEDLLSEYEAGHLNSKDLASEIMHALLCRGLPKNVEWDISYPLEREIACDIGEMGYSYFIEAKEKNSSSDEEERVPHSASATGNVIFLHDQWEIRIDNFSCAHDVESDSDP
jgi:hypothetical protein